MPWSKDQFDSVPDGVATVDFYHDYSGCKPGFTDLYCWNKSGCIERREDDLTRRCDCGKFIVCVSCGGLLLEDRQDELS